MAVIEINRLTKRYGERIGVDGLSLQVEEGALYGFLGPNGSGKSTTIRTLLGFMHPTEGAASVLGMDCWRESHHIKAEVGYISGDLRLYPWMTLRNSLDCDDSVLPMPPPNCTNTGCPLTITMAERPRALRSGLR